MDPRYTEKVSGYRFQVSGFRFQVPGFRFQVSGYRFMVYWFIGFDAIGKLPAFNVTLDVYHLPLRTSKPINLKPET